MTRLLRRSHFFNDRWRSPPRELTIAPLRSSSARILSAPRRVLEPAPAPTPGPSAHELLRRRYPPPPAPVALPPPAGAAPYRLGFDAIVGPAGAAAVARANRLRLHALGDTGGHDNPGPQQAVAAAMETELTGADPVRLLYHLGDVVYPHGEPSGYETQFHGAYRAYRAPIVGVPGNHDGECPPERGGRPLSAFTAQFCAPGDEHPDRERRDADGRAFQHGAFGFATVTAEPAGLGSITASSFAAGPSPSTPWP